MSTYAVKPLTHPIRAVVHLPGAVGLTQRAMVAAALADGTSQLSNVAMTDQVRDLTDMLRSLGVSIRLDEAPGRLDIAGTGGYWPNSEANLFFQRDETIMHLIAAACCLGRGRYRLNAAEPLREMPVKTLLDALIDLGATLACAGRPGHLPIQVLGAGLRGGTVRGAFSTSAISAVLLVAPCAQSDVFVELAGSAVEPCEPATTLAVMETFGVQVVADGMQRFIVPAPQRYRAATCSVEPDAAIAGCFLAAPAIAGGTVTVEGIITPSVQADTGFINALEQMGCRVERSAMGISVAGPDQAGRLGGIEVDLTSMPDAAVTLAVLALFADGPTRIRNIAPLPGRHPERITNLARELTRLGAKVELVGDSLTIVPPRRIQPATIDPHGDARLAASFTLVGLATAGIVIRDPQCVRELFPEFFTHLERMCL